MDRVQRTLNFGLSTLVPLVTICG